ncbi:hypothetical protein ACFVVA_41400 [Kitasatospora sp. NPDC058048]|uniref:hypothetical protein n=1 Tax=Kitasatospora sp. NPDC058048 TaxID=3346313 RepID=UPI0036D9238E
MPVRVYHSSRHLAAAEHEDLRTRPGRVFLPPGGEPWRRRRRTAATTAPVRRGPLVLDLPGVLPGTLAWIRPAPYLAEVLGLAAGLLDTPPDTATQAVLYPLPAWALKALRDVAAALRSTLLPLGEDLGHPTVRTPAEMAADLESLLVVLELDGPAVREAAADLMLGRRRKGRRTALAEVHAQWARLGVPL